MEKTSKILQYRFEDKKAAIMATVIGNLAMGLIILFADWENFMKVPQTQYCLASGLLVLLLIMNYHWKNVEVNGLIVILYVITVMVELYFLGLPKSPMAFSGDTASKGFLFEILINLLPYLYISLRVLLVIPLISILLSRLPK
jgi:hypothetical protein